MPRTRDERRDYLIELLAEYRRTGFFPEKRDVTDFTGLRRFVVLKDTRRDGKVTYYVWHPEAEDKCSQFQGSRSDCIHYLAKEVPLVSTEDTD